MEYAPPPPTRRDRMVAALRMLMLNDDIDPELLRPGTQWVTAVDLNPTPKPVAVPQDTTEQTSVPTDLPEPRGLPIDPALCAQSPYPMDIRDSPDAPVQSWLGDLYLSPAASSNLQTDTLGCDFMLDLGWTSNEWDAMLSSPELDRITSTSISTSTSTSTLPDPIAHTPQSSPVPVPSVDDVSMRPPAHRSLSGDRRPPEESAGLRPPKRQRAHYMIEKRYRAGLHERFEALRDCVETWKQQQQQQQQQQSSAPPSPGDTADGTNEGQNRGSTRLNKSEVLCQAVAYIKLLQEENEVVMEHMKLLIRRFRATKQALQHC